MPTASPVVDLGLCGPVAPCPWFLHFGERRHDPGVLAGETTVNEVEEERKTERGF